MIGRTLGNYRIIEQIGLGGMATVYKGYDPDTDRYVAVKILPQQFSADPQFRERFQREAKAIAKLEHLHILPIFAYGEDDGISYMAMRYLQAGTLTDRISRGALPFTEAGRILSQLAGALDHAHAHGILHRDMKPSNVLLDDDGNAFLMDFGIAKIVEATVDLTGDRLLGTPAYMSPEQCQGFDLGPATDIYSLGIILYEMVTGRRPFHAETPVAVILQQLNDPLPPPHELRPDLPPRAETVIFKALAKQPESRYKTAGELANAFNQAIVGAETAVGTTRPVGTPPPEPNPIPEPATMPAQKRQLPAWAWGVIGVVAAAVLITGGFLLANRNGVTDQNQIVDVVETSSSETAVSATNVPASTTSAQSENPQPVALSPAPECQPGETQLFFDDFEDGNLGGWDLADVNGRPSTAGWHIASQAENHVLIGTDHNWARVQNTVGRDYTLSLRLRAAPDSTDAAFHINLRMSENGRYYASTNEIRRDPDNELLASMNIQHDEQWHEVTIRADGSHITFLWDGRQLAGFDDPQPLPAGIIALENTGGTVWYDDILLCAVPASAAEAEPTSPPDAPTPFVSEAQTTLHFVDSNQSVGSAGCGKPAGGDLNGDALPDIFVAQGNGYGVWLNAGGGMFVKGNQVEDTNQEDQLCANHVALGDLDGDGDTDALVGIFRDQSGGDNIVWMNDGGGSFTDSGQRLGGSHSWAVALGDLDNDGDLDIFDASGGPSKVWLNEGNGRFTDSNQSLGSGDSVSIGLGDLDGDGDLDAFIANFDHGEPNAVFLNDGHGSFQETDQQLGEASSIGVALGDLDGDGDPDAFVANGNGSEPNAVWLNEGNGRFNHSGQLLGDEDSWAVALGDLDGDGDLDAFVGNGAGIGGQANTIWLNDGSGHFSDSGLRLGNAGTRHIILGDLDGDGDLDAFVGNENENKIWLNQGGED